MCWHDVIMFSLAAYFAKGLSYFKTIVVQKLLSLQRIVVF